MINDDYVGFVARGHLPLSPSGEVKPPTVRELRAWLFQFQEQDKPVDRAALEAWLNSSPETRQRIRPI